MKKNAANRHARITIYCLCVAAAVLALALYLHGIIVCPVRCFFGIPCPGCGMTRALLSALRLDFSAAFAYHPLWVAVLPAAALIAFLAIKGRKKALYVTITACSLLLLFVWIFRLLFN